jgi:hypothetical protein
MRRLILLLAVAALVGSTALTIDAGAATPRARAVKQRIQPFGSCKALVSYARRRAPKERRYSGGPVVAPGVTPPSRGPEGDYAGAPGSPQAAPDASHTNNQEEGVGEPDIVKTSRGYIFAIAGNRLNAVDARAATPKLLGSLELSSYGGQMFVRAGRAFVLSYAYSPVEPPPSSPAAGASGGDSVHSSPIYYRPATQITELDVSDPSAMRVLRTETIDGIFIGARRNGATMRVVLSTTPAGLDYTASPPFLAKARAWLPQARFENKRTGAKRSRFPTTCRHVRRPRVFAGLDVLTVLTVDMEKGLPAVDSDALMTDGQTVYASKEGLYVATQRFLPPPSSQDEPPPPLTTAIHRFDIAEPGVTSYSASGEAPGYVIGQFALSEHEGVLRVASTDSPVWWPGAPQQESRSYVSTLKQSGGVLLPLGRVGGLGRGELIQAVRFLGDAGYVVTFRRIDPLYTLDLSRPAHPTVEGQLKLLGYSAYLHPIADGLLLGVGQDATPEGRSLGTQLSLFDVSDLARPQRLSVRGVGGSSSEVEYDHHAFLYWGPEKLAVIPVSVYGPGNPFVGAIGFRVGKSEIDEVGRITHDAGGQYTPGITRSVVVGKRLFTISQLGAKASVLSSLADEAWVPFPAQYQPGPQPQAAFRSKRSYGGPGG